MESRKTRLGEENYLTVSHNYLRSNYLGGAMVVITQTNPPNLPNATKTRFTPDEYRAIEETAEERHEYCNGEILAISGGSEVYRAIACNLMSLPINSDDRVVWRLAQSNQMILLTANRSMKGDNSLFTSNSRGNNFYITPRDYY